jgi:hypothetical protein
MENPPVFNRCLPLFLWAISHGYALIFEPKGPSAPCRDLRAAGEKCLTAVEALDEEGPGTVSKSTKKQREDIYPWSIHVLYNYYVLLVYS